MSHPLEPRLVALLAGLLICAAARAPAQDAPGRGGAAAPAPPPFPNPAARGGGTDVFVPGAAGSFGREDLGGRGRRDRRDHEVDVLFPLALPGYSGSFGTFGNVPPPEAARSTATVTILKPPRPAARGARSEPPREALQLAPEPHVRPLAGEAGADAAQPAARVADPAAMPAEDPLAAAERQFRAGAYFEAADAYRRAIPLHPQEAAPRRALAHALFALGDYEAAAAFLARALALDPELRASAPLPAADEAEEQILLLRTHRRLHPEDAAALFLDAYVALLEGDAERSAALLAERADPAALTLRALAEHEARRER